MNVSIIIPLLNESESINELNNWIFRTFTNTDLEFEVIYIDDGSDDSSWSIIEEIAKSNLNIKGCLLYTSPSPRDGLLSRMPSSA